MKQEFVPYEQAFALLDLGFDEPCVACFTFGNKKYIEILEEFTTSSQLGEQMDRRLKNILEDDQDQYTLEDYFDVQDESSFAAPTFSQAFRWFREKHALSSWVYNGYMDKYFYTILRNGRLVQANKSVTTYEEAELACLKKLIKLSTQTK